MVLRNTDMIQYGGISIMNIWLSVWNDYHIGNAPILSSNSNPNPVSTSLEVMLMSGQSCYNYIMSQKK